MLSRPANIITEFEANPTGQTKCNNDDANKTANFIKRLAYWRPNENLIFGMHKKRVHRVCQNCGHQSLPLHEGSPVQFWRF